MDEHHVIISADSHCGADLRQYKDYLESKFHNDFDEWADVIEADQVKMDELYAGLEKSPRNVGIGGDPELDADRNFSSSRRLKEQEDGCLKYPKYLNQMIFLTTLNICQSSKVV